MRLWALVAALCGLIVPVSAAPQLWREPYMSTRPVEMLEAAGSPVALRSGVLAPGLPLDALRLTLRARTPDRVRLPFRGITVRLAAGPFDDRMLTFRLRATQRPDELPTMFDRPDNDGWKNIAFERVAEDPPMQHMGIRRDTRILVTIEQVSNGSGSVVFDNPDSRERLWEALIRRAPLQR